MDGKGLTNPVTNPRDSLALKLAEPEVSKDDPWVDDVLDRRQIADRLTNLISHQSMPLVISIHGQWGTGKTFMLKRWQQDLESQKFKAICFNAWEDDFSDDPLLSIIGQMWNYFERDKGSKVRRLVASVKENAVPLSWANVKSVVSNKTGLTFETGQDKQTELDLIEEYVKQIRTRTELREQLGKMSSAVCDGSGQPLVFIIDELDRCRPTFAIELLERVKHIFDVPNMVFVFGINRDELCKALSSVYGDIGTDVYLRRFFDFEFNLPEVGSERFAYHLVNNYQLNRVPGSIIEPRDLAMHVSEFVNLSNALGLTLRDIDYGIRLISVMVRTVRPGTYIHPNLLAVLLAMKFKKPELYRSLAAGDFATRDIMDSLENACRRDLVDEGLVRDLDRVEGYLYCADNANTPDQQRGENAETEILRLQQADVEFGFEIISHRARNAEPQQLPRILQAIQDGRHLSMNIDNRTLSMLASLIDTYQPMLRH